MRLWVEITHENYCMALNFRQPLREAVSWNVIWKEYFYGRICQPLREAVSWNIALNTGEGERICQPLREAVSWNSVNLMIRRPFDVSLFVRLWVEMTLYLYKSAPVHRQPLREAVSWNNRRRGKKALLISKLKVIWRWTMYFTDEKDYIMCFCWAWKRK